MQEFLKIDLRKHSRRQWFSLLPGKKIRTPNFPESLVFLANHWWFWVVASTATICYEFQAKTPKNLQGIPVFLHFSKKSPAPQNHQYFAMNTWYFGGGNSRILAFSTKRYLFCFKTMLYIAPRDHFFAFGGQKGDFQALPGLAKTHQIFFIKTQTLFLLIGVMV